MIHYKANPHIHLIRTSLKPSNEVAELEKIINLYFWYQDAFEKVLLFLKDLKVARKRHRHIFDYLVISKFIPRAHEIRNYNEEVTLSPKPLEVENLSIADLLMRLEEDLYKNQIVLEKKKVRQTDDRQGI